MAVSNIKQSDNIFEVTFTPNLIERWFGFKEKIVKYKQLTDVEYINYPGRSVYIRDDGSCIGATHHITTVLDNWKRKF